MDVRQPFSNKLFTLKQDNLYYWKLCVSRSQYDEIEIVQALSDIKAANDKLHKFLSSAYDLTEGMGVVEGWESDDHRKLDEMLSNIDYLSPNMSENSHSNCFPVRKWQKEVSKLGRQIERIEKFIEEF